MSTDMLFFLLVLAFIAFIVVDILIWLVVYRRSGRGIWGEIDANLTVATFNIILAAVVLTLSVIIMIVR